MSGCVPIASSEDTLALAIFTRVGCGCVGRPAAASLVTSQVKSAVKQLLVVGYWEYEEDEEVEEGAESNIVTCGSAGDGEVSRHQFAGGVVAPALSLKTGSVAPCNQVTQWVELVEWRDGVGGGATHTGQNTLAICCQHGNMALVKNQDKSQEKDCDFKDKKQFEN